MRVLQLWRYPVKSLGGERMASCDVNPTGLEGDRRWGIVDLETDRVLTARREPRLLFAAARLLNSEEVRIVLPSGEEASSDGDLCKWLGRKVELRRAGVTGGVYENPLDFEKESDWVSWQGPPDAWHDMKRARLSLVSTATIGTWDVRRFRPNVLLDGSGEDEFVGSQVRLGTALLDITKQIDRCVMVARPQPGIDADLDILRTINRDRGTYLAVGALVRDPGFVREGDSIERLVDPLRQIKAR
jgi:hypothetical protein